MNAAAEELLLDHRALVLEEKGRLALRDFDTAEPLGPRDVRVAIRRVGICGSDVHYFTHGAIGQFVVREPMILGHEASGVVIETGGEVDGLAVGDRVCMEPGIPRAASQATRLGLYNLDPAVRFWATPPVHGVLRRTVVHPAAFTFKVPDNVSFAEAAMVEPLAVGVHSVNKARAAAGHVAVIVGAGPIGLVTALAAIAVGAGKVIVADVDDAKLALAAGLGAIATVNVRSVDLAAAIAAETGGWGADVVYECSGNDRAAEGVFSLVCPGGTIVMVGIPGAPIRYDVALAQMREARIEHVFRYAHVFPACLRLMSSGTIDVKPLITRTFPFAESVEAFELASRAPAGEVKIQIALA